MGTWDEGPGAVNRKSRVWARLVCFRGTVWLDGEGVFEQLFEVVEYRGGACEHSRFGHGSEVGFVLEFDRYADDSAFRGGREFGEALHRGEAAGKVGVFVGGTAGGEEAALRVDR